MVSTNIVGSDPTNEYIQLEDRHTLDKAMVESGQMVDVDVLMPDIQWSQDAAARIERIRGAGSAYEISGLSCYDDDAHRSGTSKAHGISWALVNKVH